MRGRRWLPEPNYLTLTYPNASLFQDAIDLYRFMNRTDRFSEQPRHRPFMLRNLGYLRRRTGTCPMVVESNLLSEQRACKKARRKEANEEEVELMPSTIKFNFIRNNLCFGDKSAIVQCFHVTENNYNFGAVVPLWNPLQRHYISICIGSSDKNSIINIRYEGQREVIAGVDRSSRLIFP